MRSPPSVRGSRTGRPILVLLDLLSRRWTLRLLWELRDAPLNFRALREAMDNVSPSVMQARLNDLRDARLVGLSSVGYALTDLGRELLESLLPLHALAERWADQTSSEP